MNSETNAASIHIDNRRGAP